VQSFRVNLGRDSHQVLVGQGLLDQVGEFARQAGLAGRVAIITDSNVARLYLARVRKAVELLDPYPTTIELEPGEQSKSLGTLARVYDRLVEAKLERDCVIVALGGGVVGDLAGFAAATFLRGVALIQVPTTLLAQVDSALGGKTGINHPKAKNLIGAFYQPRLIVADVTTLESLPERVFREGLAEMVKYAAIRDAPMFDELEHASKGIVSRNPALLEHFVTMSLRHKAQIVEADEREGGLRAILNFGHTVGHALEARAEFGGLLHGEAVAIGMAVEAKISQTYAGLPAYDAERLIRWLNSVGLSTRLPFEQCDEPFIDALTLDKKRRKGGELNLVLLRQLGQAVTKYVPIEQFLIELNRIAGTAQPRD